MKLRISNFTPFVLFLPLLLNCGGPKTKTDGAVPTSPTISAQPANVSVSQNTAAAFSVTATGTAPLSYQWRKGGTNIGGANTTTFTIPSVQSSDAGGYDVVVSNSTGSATSDLAILTVSAALTAPSISTQPVNQSVTAGASATFTVAASGNPAPTFQWERSPNGSGWTAISGATSASYTLSGVQLTDNGSSYRCKATNSQGSASSNPATLTVSAALTAPSISTQPVNQSVSVGASATFTVAASGNPAPTFQWERSPNGSGWTAISGATSASYTLSGVQLTDNGSSYRCKATNSQGSATSNAATLTVSTTDIAPAITAQPRSRTVPQGTVATFSVVASGTSLTYQWRKSSTPISGATTSSYSIPSAQAAHAGSYDVLVSNNGGSVASNSVTLAVSNPATILVANPGADADIRPNLNTALASAASGDEILLPLGTFTLSGTVQVGSKRVSVRGQGIGKTVLYRSESMTDGSLKDAPMIRYLSSSDVVVSDITFRSKKPFPDGGDPGSGTGGSLASDIGLSFEQTTDFTVTRCRFEFFGNGAVSVVHDNYVARGLIYKNEFFRNFKGDVGANIPLIGLGLGYGVVVYGINTEWIANPAFGTDNFIFVEDNTFDYHRHSIAAGGNALYVFRNNRVTNNRVGPYTQAIDAHEARGTGNGLNTYSTRAVEIYNNTVINTTFWDGTPIVPGHRASDLVERAIQVRGGEALIYGNTISGYRFGTGMSIDPITSGYPVLSQIGYLSGVNFGDTHTGTDDAHGSGDLFHWNDGFIAYVGIGGVSVGGLYNFDPARIKVERDYHTVPKPNYLPYTYPHPRRQ